jgi:UDP-N-acetylmuramyl tripeptide synthase
MGGIRTAPSPRPTARRRFSALVVRGAARVARLAGAGAGGVIGGRVLLAFDRGALADLAADREIVLVSGTNGKTTTSAFLAAALRTEGPVITNDTGANLESGMVTVLARELTVGRAVLEIDEAVLPRTLSALGPRAVVLLNLSRDQLDRYGEVRMVADRWRRALVSHDEILVVANADDPLVVWAAGSAPRAVWVAAGAAWLGDAGTCPSCGRPLVVADGTWTCQCGFRRPEPDYVVHDGTLVAADGPVAPVRVRLPGRFNVANAAIALTAAVQCGAEPAAASAAIEHIESVAGRYRTGRVRDHLVRLFLAKNPAGWRALLDDFGAGAGPLVVAINARIADGADTSWLWDVPFERLVGRDVVATGDRAHDLAVRLQYAGVHVDVRPGHPAAALDALPPGDGGAVDVLANYTAFRDLYGAIS